MIPLGILGSARVAAGVSYYDEVMADSPLGYWRLDEASGATIGDSSGNGNGFAFTGGGYTRNVAGAIPGNAATSYISAGGAAILADAAWMDVSAFTVEAIVKTTGTANSTIMRRDTGGNPNRIFLFRTDTGGTVTFATWNSSGTLVATTSTGTVNDGNWHHVAATSDGTNLRIYIDGAADGTGSNGNRTGAASIQFLSWSSGEYFVGTMDEMAFYGSALSASRIAAHASAAGL